jgi:hypothetical protein
MKPTRLAVAAAILLGASGASFAQSTATIVQSGSYDYATIDQNAPAGSVLAGTIVQSRGADNVARIRQEADASGGTVQASARITQWATGETFGDIIQIGTTGGTTAQLTQESSGNNGGGITQKNVSAATATGLQSAESSSVTISQVGGGASAYAEAKQVGDGWGSWLMITQGDAWFGGGGVTNTQARVFQDAEASSAHVSQRSVSDSSGYISQGSSERPGFYFSSLANAWVEVDASVAGGVASESNAILSQDGGSNLTGYILQYGSFNNASLGQNGSFHVGGILQTGSGNHADLTQLGSFNTAAIFQYGNGGYASLFQNGTGNTGRITQR